MASSFAPDKRPKLPAPIDDPFVTTNNATASPHHRYSNFNYELFAAGPGSSPRQAKRALEAHLAETERRLDEAGKLGTALVSQRKTLTEQLQEVEKLQSEGELNPELRQKLAEIEKEYNDLARESARAFLPKQRVPSNEINPGSPFAPEGRSGGRVSRLADRLPTRVQTNNVNSDPPAHPSLRVRPPGLLLSLVCRIGRSGTNPQVVFTISNSQPRLALP